MHFFRFEFPREKAYLSKARDMFCFMAFTSLRYSDLAALKPVNIVDGCLDFCTEKQMTNYILPSMNMHKRFLISMHGIRAVPYFQFLPIRN